MGRRIIASLSFSLTFILVLATFWLYRQVRTLEWVGDLGTFVFIAGIALVGGLILVRRPENRLGRIFCTVGLLYASSGAIIAYVNYVMVMGNTNSLLPWIAVLGNLASNISWLSSATFLFLLFPDGRLPSARWRLPAIFVTSVIVSGLFLSILAPGPLGQITALENPLGHTALAPFASLVIQQLQMLFVLSVMICLASVFIRFRFANPQTKRQIKWMAYLGLFGAILYIAQVLVPLIWNRSDLSTVLDATGTLLFSAIPLVIGIAILRYQLFDIDILIRRTLQYTLLTVLLALLYFGSVTVLQSIFTALGGARSSLITVISTLVIAAIFNPLRRRVQEVIDHRFYRRKYNAEQALTRFALIARSEVDLTHLTDSLREVVEETLAPDSFYLTLYPSHRMPRS